MQMIIIFLCTVPTAFGIIVKDPPPSPNDYKYSYDVQDPTTGDSKSKHEVRQGNIVTGAYTVVGPDGTKRTVEYTADDKHGFKAVISEEPGEPPAPVTHSPATYHQPILSHGFPGIQYQSTSRPAYVYQAKPMVYFTPHNEYELKAPIENGHYFVPTNEEYLLKH